MRVQIRVWGLRVLTLVIIVLAVRQWGIPNYRRYVTPKKVELFVPTTRVRAGKFVVSFHQIGTLQAERSVPVTTDSGGKIITLVPDGKIVKAGEVLAEMDTTDLVRDVNDRRLAHENALADVSRMKAELTLLQEQNKTDLEKTQAQFDFDGAELDQAEAELNKYKRLAADRLVPGTKVDEQEIEVRARKLKVLQSTKDLALKKTEIQSKEQQKKADVSNKEFSAQMAKSNLETAQRRVLQATITAPTSGIVVLDETWSSGDRRKIQPGDSIWPRHPICELPDLASMLVKVQVGEADAPKLRLGLPVLIKLEAVKNKLFHGSVKDISRLVKESDPWDVSATPGRKNFDVTISIKEIDTKTLKPGMTADVEFICDTVGRAVHVPLEAVMERDTKTYVFVKTGKRYKLTRVKTGPSNDNFIVISKGLKGRETIALRDPNEPIEALETQAPTEKKEAEKTSPVPEAGKR